MDVASQVERIRFAPERFGNAFKARCILPARGLPIVFFNILEIYFSQSPKPSLLNLTAEDAEIAEMKWSSELSALCVLGGDYSSPSK
jgi:hypothetical protein